MYLLLLILATKLFGCVVAIDLEALRIQTSTEYVNNAKAKSSLNLQRLQKVSYLETASELVKTVAPGATFKIVPGHYTGSNGLSHVHFKQRFHDVEIDNALFNVNIDNNGQVFSFGNSFFMADFRNQAQKPAKLLFSPSPPHGSS